MHALLPITRFRASTRFAPLFHTASRRLAPLAGASLLMLTQYGCVERYEFFSTPPPRCFVSVRATDSAGAPITGTATVGIEQSWRRAVAPGVPLTWGCTAPFEADATLRWNHGLNSLRPSLCSSTIPEYATLRTLLCPAGSAGLCKVPGSAFCAAQTGAAPDWACSTPPTLALPDCPAPAAPAGTPRLCIDPMPSVDLGSAVVGALGTPAWFRIRNCGSGRLTVPPPTLTPQIGSMASFAGPDPMTMPGLTGDCLTLAGAEAAAGAAFLGPADRAECNYFVRFRPESAGAHSAILRLTSNDTATGMVTLVFRGTGVSP